MQALADQVGFEHVHHGTIAPDANNVRGFPQDAFMDMGMDEAVAKPENNGLPRNWSAMMMGMMTPRAAARPLRPVDQGHAARLCGSASTSREKFASTPPSRGHAMMLRLAVFYSTPARPPALLYVAIWALPLNTPPRPLLVPRTAPPAFQQHPL